MSEPDLLDVVAVVGDILDALGVRWLVGGSLASTWHGEPRNTQDADLIADLRPEHAASFCAQLRGSFYVELEDVREAIGRRRSFNAIHLPTAFKVDVFVPPAGGLHDAKWSRAGRCRFPGLRRELPVTDRESLVLQKLDWFRQGGGVSEQQWRDVLGLLKTGGGGLDRCYIADWASRLGLDDLLARALREAGLEEPA